MSEILQRVFVDPWPFWAGGIVIGLMVPVLYYFHNTALGVSTGYGNLAKIVFRSKGLSWIQKTVDESFNWRMFFIVGIIAGAFVSARLSGSSLITTEMGRFTSAVNWSGYAIVLYFFAGGILLGLGARIAGGCTSGHSIHGIANLHVSSILATIMFLVGGAIAANIIRLLVSGGL